MNTDTNKQVFLVNKHAGETPLQALQRFKNSQPYLQNTPLTYAGRLDPMAEGLLLLLSGKAIKRKNDFLHLDKVYQAEILFGFSTDSLDMLGLPNSNFSFHPPSPKQLNSAINSLINKHKWSLPVFSSKTIAGKPLFELAKQHKIKPDETPLQSFEIYDINIDNYEEVFIHTEVSNSLLNIKLVNGDFRQEEIIREWQNLLKLIDTKQKATKITMTISCSSGTYIRSVASRIGNLLDTETVLYSLKRKSIGSYNLPS